ncbi:hypothetical protein BDN72DRAFT_310641 [Pluteus cervinus]|uniref:Uncharacterized protein n=1 Tax=Pluteus cervinus TaxID=181527 RepID=A0ACD3ADV4_9AGAR|nr:hypothetical protein BDN72DRAFT_310641 [Pluteus cervinus]
MGLVVVVVLKNPTLVIGAVVVTLSLSTLHFISSTLRPLLVPRRPSRSYRLKSSAYLTRSRSWR